MTNAATPTNYTAHALESGLFVAAMTDRSATAHWSPHWCFSRASHKAGPALTLNLNPPARETAPELTLTFTTPEQAILATRNPTFTACALWRLIETLPADLADQVVAQHPALNEAVAKHKDTLDLTMCELADLIMAAFGVRNITTNNPNCNKADASCATP